ncbi:MAG: hypothetical protein R6W06_11185 [Prochlorococcaceae cyanobacterium]
MLLLLLAASGCVPAHRRASWRVYPLQRSQPHDGLAVVSQPDGYGLHFWLDTDTSRQGVCRPRWNVDLPRLFNGNGSAPFSSGLATRAEFFEAVARRDVRSRLRRELEALCRQRAPRSRWQWLEPPRRPQEVKQETWPLLEEPQLLPDPAAVRQQEERLLKGLPAQPPLAPAGSATPPAAAQRGANNG